MPNGATLTGRRASRRVALWCVLASTRCGQPGSRAMVPPLDPASPGRSRQNTLAHDSTEREAHRDRSLGDGAGWCQATSVLADAERDNRVRVLISDQHHPTGRVDIESARDFALCRRPADWIQQAGGLVDTESPRWYCGHGSTHTQSCRWDGR